MLDLIQEYPVTAFNMSIWIVSIITSTYYILSMSKTGKTLFEKEIVGLTILILLALCVGQWLNIIALVIYESVDGFIIYMTEYGGGWAYNFFGVSNILIGYSVNHILKKHNNKG